MGGTAPIVVEKIRCNDFEIVVGHVRKGAFAVAVPKRPNAPRIGAQP
jgi:hypothetical protein